MALVGRGTVKFADRFIVSVDMAQRVGEKAKPLATKGLKATCGALKKIGDGTPRSWGRSSWRRVRSRPSYITNSLASSMNAFSTLSPVFALEK